MANRQPSRRALLQSAGSLALGMSLPKELSETLDKGFPGLTQAVLVPANKGLDPKWVKSLFERGKPTVYTGDELKWIGMPVGGICCGQVYLGGDGRLWYWDMYAPGTSPQFNSTGAGRYERPEKPDDPFLRGFVIELNNGQTIVPLTLEGFSQIEFKSKGSVATVNYSDSKLPLEVELVCSTPFIPLSAEDSSWPLIRMDFTLKNTSSTTKSGWLGGFIVNTVGDFSALDDRILKANAIQWPEPIIRNEAVRASSLATKNLEQDLVFEDFEGPDYGEWKVEGTAFGTGPFASDQIPERQRALRPKGKGFVNSHESRHGEDSAEADRHVGRLTSPEFTISKQYINFYIGGGNHRNETCINLLIDGAVVKTAFGRNSVALDPHCWDVLRFKGKSARIEIVDSETGGWGHITVDRIVFSDTPIESSFLHESQPDFGSLALGLLDYDPTFRWGGDISAPQVYSPWTQTKGGITSTMDQSPRATLCRSFELKPGQSKTISFAIAWHFPNFGPHPGELASITDIAKQKKHYAKRFKDAADVIRKFTNRKDELYETTKLWVDTWFDSTLPYWFLERVYIPLNTLQTSTAWWLDSGRFYAFEGVECCAGTCQHVWNYAQSVARIFPELERDTRERVDYGIAFREDGALDYRAEAHKIIAHDGQCGTIIRTYREHTMCPDDSFLRRIWPKVKKSIERMIQEDPNRDGVLEGWQYNTLDAAWKGKISWISSLYAAALQVGALMADEMGDPAFAKECRAIVAKARDEIPKQLFNGEYFQMERDASAPQSVGYGPGCHIDLVLGDSFLWQIGVEPVLPRDKVKTALKNLYKYNFAPDAGGYRNAMQAVIKGGRWYAMPGEPGLLMTTFPKGGAEVASGKGADTWSAGYFKECMHGFEYQAAAHMFAEGLLDEGMTVVRSIHDRYSAKKRNPFNEIECGDHYARSMASYGAFLTLCGFRYHGPRGRIGFAPMLEPEKFKAPFTAAEGWGTYEQTRSSSSLKATYAVKYGRLTVRELAFEVAKGHRVKSAKVSRGTHSIPSAVRQEGQKVTLALAETVGLPAGERLSVTMS